VHTDVDHDADRAHLRPRSSPGWVPNEVDPGVEVGETTQVVVGEGGIGGGGRRPILHERRRVPGPTRPATAQQPADPAADTLLR
jgi:hypothetical protein